jgi:NTE family protein
MPPPTRVGLVLGAGGVAGGAFHAGVLAALAEVAEWDPRGAEIIVGTSAGSISGTSLRAGLPAPDLLARAQDRPLSAEGRRVIRSVGPIPGPPPLRPARQPRAMSDLTATLARAARRPFAARPTALAAALLPEGTVSTDMISSGIGALLPGQWPDDLLWICSVRQSDARRVVFGRGGDRPPIKEAVAASCAIPGFFAPVVIDGEAHIDGGVHSPTNADVLREEALDLVIVSSPMSRRGRRPRLSPDQPMRAWASTLLDSEARRLRRAGITVGAFQPDDTVLAAMGLNPMDPNRRGAIASATFEMARARLERADRGGVWAAIRSAT